MCLVAMYRGGSMFVTHREAIIFRKAESSIYELEIEDVHIASCALAFEEGEKPS